VALILQSSPARQALLPLLDEGEVTHPPLRAVLAALRARPDATAEGLMTDLDDESARAALAALLVEEREADDEGASILEFQRRLERRQRLRRMRALSRSIAEAQAAGGTEAPMQEALLMLHRESREVYELSRAVAASDHTAPGSVTGGSHKE
jgi:hypothetical protein